MKGFIKYCYFMWDSYIPKEICFTYCLLSGMVVAATIPHKITIPLSANNVKQSPLLCGRKDTNYAKNNKQNLEEIRGNRCNY